MFYFEEEDGIGGTGIEDVNEEPAVVDDEWYTLQGLRLNRRATPIA